jgi:hypothetical protein
MRSGTSFGSGLAGFLRAEFVRSSLLMSRSATLCGNLPLTYWVHRAEASTTSSGLLLTLIF